MSSRLRALRFASSQAQNATVASSSSLRQRWRNILADFLPLGGLTQGNAVTLYREGHELYQTMWDAIKNAKERVLFGTYTLSPDAVGTSTINALLEARKKGCEVTLLYDQVGSFSLKDEHLIELVRSGVVIEAFNPYWRWQWPWKWKVGESPVNRNHRKLLVVDEDIGFVGGMNVGREWANETFGGLGYYRDTHVRVMGPCVHDLVDVFHESLAEARLMATLEQRTTKERPKLAFNTLGTYGRHLAVRTRQRMRRLWRSIPSLRAVYNKLARHSKSTVGHVTTVGRDPAHRDILVQVLSSNARAHKFDIQRAISISLAKTERTCYMTTPYFLPPLWLTKSIIAAARRGVDVRILTAGISDQPLYKHACRHIYDVFLKRGVRIFELNSKALHAKTFTIDGMYCTVGSFNLDLFSTDRNLEVSLFIFDPRLAHELESHFSEDLEQATEVTLETYGKRAWYEKLRDWGLYRFAHIFTLGSSVAPFVTAGEGSNYLDR